MTPPGKTTLFRMQEAARLEAERIEITQDARVREKLQPVPLPSQIKLRDDFAGIVRLIDAIESDQFIKTKITEKMKAQRLLDAASAPVADVDSEEEAVEA